MTALGERDRPSRRQRHNAGRRRRDVDADDRRRLEASAISCRSSSNNNGVSIIAQYQLPLLTLFCITRKPRARRQHYVETVRHSHHDQFSLGDGPVGHQGHSPKPDQSSSVCRSLATHCDCDQCAQSPVSIDPFIHQLEGN